MRKFLKVFVLLTFVFSLTFKVYAESTDESNVDTGEDVIPASSTSSPLDTQLQAIEAYCREDAKSNGCLYDDSNKLYTEFRGGYFLADHTEPGDNVHGNISTEYYDGSITIPSGIKLTRGYQTFDGNGNAIYASCYRYDITDSDIKKEGHALGKGTVFIFNFVTKKRNSCASTFTSIIPAEGVEGYVYTEKIVGSGQAARASYELEKTYTFNGTQNIRGGTDITFNNWKAVNGGSCPNVFGYTANTKWYTSSANKYFFSNNVQDFNVSTYAFGFIKINDYSAKPGCTVADVDGDEKNRELLLSEIKKEVNAFACPSNIEEMYKLSDELDDYYRTLRSEDGENPYRVLWSKGLSSDVTKASEDEINKYISDKMTACQYQICKISNEEKNEIDKNKGTACKNGCDISNVNEPSDDPNAQCYCCGGSQGCTYKWMVADSGSQCSLQKDTPMVQCIGTTKDVECRNCLQQAYLDAEIGSEKIKCLMDSEILKNITEAQLREANSEAADESIELEAERNSELRKNTYSNLIKQPELDIYGVSMTCAALLGPGITKILNFAIDTVRIIGVIAAIVMAMVTLIPAVNKGDQGELNSAIKKCIWIAVVLVLVVLFPLLVRVIGNLFDFDTSCIF